MIKVVISLLQWPGDHGRDKGWHGARHGRDGGRAFFCPRCSSLLHSHGRDPRESWLHGGDHGRNHSRDNQEKPTEGVTALVTSVTGWVPSCISLVTVVPPYQRISPLARHGRDELPESMPELLSLKLVVLSFKTYFLGLFSFS